jgi:hypothetical protein
MYPVSIRPEHDTVRFQVYGGGVFCFQQYSKMGFVATFFDIN